MPSSLHVNKSYLPLSSLEDQHHPKRHRVLHPVVQLEGAEDTPSNLHNYMYMDKFILPNKKGNREGGGEREREGGGGSREGEVKEK